MSIKSLLLISSCLACSSLAAAETNFESVGGDLDFAAIPAASTFPQAQPRDLAQTHTNAASRYYYYFTRPDTEYGQPIPVAPRALSARPATPVVRQASSPTPQATRIIYAVPPQRTPTRVDPSAVAYARYEAMRARQSEKYNYLSIKGFVNQAEAYPFKTGSTITYETDMKTGYTAAAAFGRRLGSLDSSLNLKLELEGAFREMDVENFIGPLGANSTKVNASGGRTRIASGMLNAIAQLNIGRAVRPYIGAGVGAAEVDHDNYADANGVFMNGDDFSVAYQGFAGAAFGIGENIELMLEGRHFVVQDVKKTYLTSNVRTESDFKSNEIGVGLNFRF